MPAILAIQNYALRLYVFFSFFFSKKSISHDRFFLRAGSAPATFASSKKSHRTNLFVKIMSWACVGVIIVATVWSLAPGLATGYYHDKVELLRGDLCSSSNVWILSEAIFFVFLFHSTGESRP